MLDDPYEIARASPDALPFAADRFEELGRDDQADELISVIDVARQHGKQKATVFKILKRLGVQPRKRRNTFNNNQLVAYITEEEFRLVALELRTAIRRDNAADAAEGMDDRTAAETGAFYLIRLEPEFDPGRFKVGFTAGMPERIRHLRCSAPFAVVLREWPCRRLWEKTAIDSATIGCERLHTEVFRTGSLDEIVARCDRFFAIMPCV